MIIEIMKAYLHAQRGALPLPRHHRVPHHVPPERSLQANRRRPPDGPILHHPPIRPLDFRRRRRCQGVPRGEVRGVVPKKIVEIVAPPGGSALRNQLSGPRTLISSQLNCQQL
jgi:hypothetical protein